MRLALLICKRMFQKCQYRQNAISRVRMSILSPTSHLKRGIKYMRGGPAGNEDTEDMVMRVLLLYCRVFNNFVKLETVFE